MAKPELRIAGCYSPGTPEGLYFRKSVIEALELSRQIKDRTIHFPGGAIRCVDELPSNTDGTPQ